MTITRVGTNATYASGWETAFSKGKRGTKKAAASKKKSPAKKGSKKGKR